MGKLAERPLKTVVVGGGPAGLFYALLAKRRMPRHDVVVYERNSAAATFGFGVVFSERTLGGFAEADPVLYDGLAAAGVAWEDIEVRRHDGVIRCSGHGFSAISRRTLLGLMQARAQEVGVEIQFEHEAADDDIAGADLVLAADGANSVVRDRRAADFEVVSEAGAARYIWFATPQPFDALTFPFIEDEHGHWGAHAYPFEDGTSTFIVETDEATWRRAGLDRAESLVPGQSDMASLRFCEQLFADHLGGHGLLENNSKWLQFRTLRCGSWRSGKIALAGDAAHTAHFSVGSGTKMAMEDAVGLVEAVADADEVTAALARYEAARRPSVQRIQAAARPSVAWWERFRHLGECDLEQFAFHFLSRSPMVTRGRLLTRDWRFVRRVDRWAAGALGPGADAGPLASGLRIGPLELPNRVVAAPPADVDPRVALGGLALAGAGLVMASSANTQPDAVAWVHRHTASAVGLRLPANALAEAAERAAEDEFDMLAVPLGALAAGAWPVDRVLMTLVEAPESSEGDEADAVLASIRSIGEGRTLVVGVSANPSGDAVDPLLFCGRVVQELELTCAGVDLLASEDAAVTAVLSGRVDLVQGLPSLATHRWRQSGSMDTAGVARGVRSPA